MLFSSATFLFLYLPVVIGIYYAVPRKARNAFLLVANLVFYGWGEWEYAFLMLACALVNQVAGMIIEAKPRYRKAALVGALALSLGMDLQNFPEGAAISLPLKKEGLSNTRSFVYGALSGIVEPIAGVLGVLAAGAVTGVMPWLLAFAAGAMIYVVVEELIPEANLGEHSHTGTLSVMLGFLVMMVLDVALG